MANTGNRFDAMAKDLARGMSRREALRRFGGGVAGALLASLGIGKASGQGLYTGFYQGCGAECRSVSETKEAFDACVQDCAECRAHGGNACVALGGTVQCCRGQSVCVVTDEATGQRSCQSNTGTACPPATQCCRKEICYRGFCCVSNLAVCYNTRCPE